MPALSTPAGLLYFAHVPKTGGTSVEEYLIRNYGPLQLIDRGWHEARLRGERADRPFRCSDQHLIWSDALTCLPQVPDQVFGIVRDPLERLKSEYKFQIRFRPGVRWLTRLGFSAWAATLLKAARRDPYICDNHLRPQSDFLPPEAYVFRLEEGLADLPLWIAEHFGAPKVDLQMHHSQKAPKETAHPITVTPGTLRRIRAFYAVDYERFGYPPPDPARTGFQGHLAQGVAQIAGLSAPWLVRAYRTDRI